MYTLENFILAFVAIGVVFLILGLVVLSKVSKIKKEQEKNYHLLFDYMEKSFASNTHNLNAVANNIIGKCSGSKMQPVAPSNDANIQTLIEVVQGMDIKVHNADFQAIKLAINTILENQKKESNQKANITIAGKPEATQTINKTVKMTTEDVAEIVKQLKEEFGTNSTITVTPDVVVVSAMTITERVLEELHDVDTIYNDKGAVLEKLGEDYNRTYDVIFEILSNNLL